jgi:SecD-like export protein
MTHDNHILRDADPVRHEPLPGAADRDCVRRAMLAAASEGAATATARRYIPLAIVAAAALVLGGIATVRSTISSGAAPTLQAAAVRLEIRLAEDQPTIGLRAVRIEPNRTIYLHNEAIATNDDIAQARVIAGDQPSRYGVAVDFSTTGAERMRKATANHLGLPVAILIDGEVIAAPTLRSPISGSAVISGDFSRAEAERIASGMSVR